MWSYANMIWESTPKMAAIFVIVRKANGAYEGSTLVGLDHCCSGHSSHREHHCQQQSPCE